MTLRRVPRSFPARVSGAAESMIPGTVGGRVGVASPVVFGETGIQAATSGSISASTVVVAGGAEDLHGYDAFTLVSDGAQDLTLTEVTAVEETIVLTLNGIVQEIGTDFTFDDAATISILTAMGALTGDIIQVWYALTTDIPADTEAG